MIHLNLKSSDFVSSWLDDITNDNGDNERKKFAHSALREIANQWQVPYMTIQTQGYIDSGPKKIKKEDIKLQKLIDEGGDGTARDILVLGEKMTEKLEWAYAIITILNPKAGEKKINDWARAVIEEKIVQKKAEQSVQDMHKEENELYPPEKPEEKPTEVPRRLADVAVSDIRAKEIEKEATK